MRNAAYHRVPVPRGAAPLTSSQVYLPPVKGWVTNLPYARTDRQTARVMDNWVPEVDGVRPRGGAPKKATIGSDPIEGMWSYRQGGVEKLFAASDSDIYNISGLDPDTPPSADVTGLTDGDFSVANMATAGGDFQYVCNEADSPRLYDGSTWTTITGASSPAITGVTTSLLRAVWAYRSRLFFAERDSLRFWALPTESVGGAAIEINLSGVATKGGEAWFGFSWSIGDSGDGQDDKCAFVTTAGEVMVYEGGNPQDPTDWNLVGVYQIGDPLGKRAWARIGGDVAVATQNGLVPMTQIVKRAPDELDLAALSRAIEPDWQTQGRAAVATSPWMVEAWEKRGYMIVTLPHTGAQQSQYCFIRNSTTGAWARFTGLDMQAIAEFGGDMYYGDSSGSVFAIESGGKDGGNPYTCRLAWGWDHLNRPGQVKTAQQARATFVLGRSVNVALEAHTDYANDFGSAPAAAADGAVSSLWDTAVWDTDLWDGGAATLSRYSTGWRAVTGQGETHAPAMQVTVGNTLAPDARLASFELLYEHGGLVV